MKMRIGINPHDSRNDREGVGYRLADGRTWYFATPRRRLIPRASDSELISVVATPVYPTRAQAWVDEILAIADRGEEIPYPVLFGLAAELVMLCHQLRIEHALELLEMTAEEADQLGRFLATVIFPEASRGHRAAGEQPAEEPTATPAVEPIEERNEEPSGE